MSGETTEPLGFSGDERGAALANTVSGAGMARLGFIGLRVVRLEDFEPAVPLGADEREAYLRRFGTLFVDESRVRRGGIGSVAPATNALGERFALKMLLEPVVGGHEQSAGLRGDAAGECEVRRADEETLRLAGRGPAGSASGSQLSSLQMAFREEYACHLALSGFRGFPRLYGRGMVEGHPTIVMEWVEGVTLSRARWTLALDGEGRVAPLAAARMGRDLFDLLCRMSLVGEGYVHRDISPANVMIRTESDDVAIQAEEGSFDLCLIDFGSSSPGWVESGDTSFTGSYSVVRRATADYAPPEMLSDDLEHLNALRRSPAVDVYEAASVVYELLGGRVPFDLHGEDGEVVSPYRTKAAGAPQAPCTVHEEGCDLERILAGEPEAAVAAVKTTLDYAIDPEGERVRAALELVDAQLVELVLACLEPEQKRRPAAEAVRDALSAFCANYGENVARALRGEPLIPCTAGASWRGSTSPWALRRMVRSVGSSIAAAVWLVVVVSAAWLLAGARAGFSLGDVAWSGRLAAPVVAAALAAPAACGFLARGRDGATRSGFLRGTVALLAATLVLVGLLACVTFAPEERMQGAHAAVFASCAAAWCPMVLDFATTVVPALVAEARRKLPAGGGPAGLAGLSSGGSSAGLPFLERDVDGGRLEAGAKTQVLVRDGKHDAPGVDSNAANVSLGAEDNEGEVQSDDGRE